MKNILIVDDDTGIVELLKSRLKANGYHVATAEDGLEALSKIKSEKPDLIIMDVYMPHLDGLSFFQEVQSDEELREIPILVVSGVKSMRDIFEPMKITKFLTKPFNANELLASIKECVGR